MDVLEEILGIEMDVHKIYDHGDTAFHMAAQHPRCDVKVVTLLLDMGAILDQENIYQQTPLHYFTGNTNIQADVIKLVLDSGAYVNALDKYSYSPLHNALSNPKCNHEIVKLLVERGSDILERNNDFELPLHLAADKCDPDLVRLFLNDQTDINAYDLFDISVLQHALYSSKCNPTVIKLLLERGADVLQENLAREQALHVAADRCSAEIVQLLLEKGGDPNYLDNNGLSPLNHALYTHNRISGSVRALLEAGAHVRGPYENGECILHLATDNCDPEIVKMLFKYALLERSWIDWNCWWWKMHRKFEVAASWHNYVKLCQSELASECSGQTTLKEFLVQQRRKPKNTRSFNKILQVLSTNSYVEYKQVLGGLIPTEVLKIKLQEQIKITLRRISQNMFRRNVVMLNFECCSRIMDFISNHDDLLNWIIAFYSVCY